VIEFKKFLQALDREIPAGLHAALCGRFGTPPLA